MKTVSVAVPRPVWNTYTYILPEKMTGGSLAGCRVVVPLGGSRVAGMVWCEDPDPPKGVRLKKVLERLDSLPLPPPATIELVKWAADHYCAPPGMMAAAAFPPGMQGGAVRMVEAGEGSRLRNFIRGTPIEYRVLRDMVGREYPLDRVLAEESQEGTAKSWWVPVKLPPPRTVTVVTPLESPEKLVKAGQNLKARAPKQAEILSCLATTGAIPRSDLLFMAKAGRDSLTRLRMAGLIKEVLTDSPRDPLSGSSSLESKPVPKLNETQSSTVKEIAKCGKGTFLLHGVTGSGKTEVYMRLIKATLERGMGAILLVPEISLTPLAVSRFNGRFPGAVAVLHSGLSPGERLDTWNMVQRGERRIVIGPRSAVFAPVRDLGLMVVDEEHDSSYKQETIPRYNARDLSVVRGCLEGVPVILGSASPSAESWHNAQTGRYRLLTLPDRAAGHGLPLVRLVDTSSEKHPLLSDELLSAIGKRTARGEQSIVLLNRRGHSPVQMCFSCGHVEKCPSCGISLTYHKRGEVLRCHHCGKWKSAVMRCPECSGEKFVHQGPGIQKVEDALRELLPRTRVIRMDRDTTRGRAAHWKIVEKFSRGEGDVLLGTQMVAKGHDFPEVTLAAVIGAEMGLYIPDFRAQETTFNLLLQVAGRSGRSSKAGEVIIQTLDPDNPVIRMACSHDFHGFMKAELEQRKAMGFPPFSRMARLLWSGEVEARVEHCSKAACSVPLPGGCRLLGPGEAALPRISDRWRYSALVTADSHSRLKAAVAAIRAAYEGMEETTVRMDIDIDPRNLL
jgi:primosomal protein N' (replication factor Y) (superfamily II helicase)